MESILCVLENYEYLATWILLPIEIFFLYFVLKEFKVTRKSFEWQEEEQKEKREEEINDKVRYLVIVVLVKLERKLLENNKIERQKLEKKLEDEIQQETRLPLDFCKEVIKYFFCESKHLGYDSNNWRNFISETTIRIKDFNFKPLIEGWKKSFSSDKKIEELYQNIVTYDN